MMVEVMMQKRKKTTTKNAPRSLCAFVCAGSNNQRNRAIIGLFCPDTPPLIVVVRPAAGAWSVPV